MRSAALTVALLATLSAAADESDVGRHYNGSSIVGGLVAGPHLLSDASYDGRLGYFVGAYARFHTVMTVFAAQVQYEFASNVVGLNGEDVRVQRHGASASVHFHPFFLRLFTNNYLWYVLTSFYTEGGVGLDVTVLDSRPLAIDRTSVDGGLHFGSGIEFPLGDPGGAGAFWLGLSWRWKFVFMDPLLGSHDDLHAHLFTLGLSYRSNRTSFTRVDRPEELRWR